MRFSKLSAEEPLALIFTETFGCAGLSFFLLCLYIAASTTTELRGIL